MIEPHEGKLHIDAAGWILYETTGEIAHVPEVARGGVIAYAEGQAFIALGDTSAWLSNRLIHHVFWRQGEACVCSRVDSTSADFVVQLALQAAKDHELSPVTLLIDVADMRVREITVKRRLLPRGGVSVWISLASMVKTLTLQCAVSIGSWLGKHRIQWKAWLQKNFGLHDGHWYDYDSALTSTHGFPAKYHDYNISILTFMLLSARWLGGGKLGMQSVQELVLRKEPPFKRPEKNLFFSLVFLCGCEFSLLALPKSFTFLLQLAASEDRERVEAFVDLLSTGAVHDSDEIVFSNASWRWERNMWRSAGTCSILRLKAGKLCLADLPEYVREAFARQAHSLLPEWVSLSAFLRTLGVEKSSMELLRQVCVQMSLKIERWLWCTSFGGDRAQGSTVHQQRKQNLQYVLSTRRFMANAQDVSIAVDGTRVGKKKILLGVVGQCGTLKTALAVPQRSEFGESALRVLNGLVRVSRHLFPEALHERLASTVLSTESTDTKRRKFQDQQRAFVNREVLSKSSQMEQTERKSTFVFLRALERMLGEAGIGSLLSFVPR
eukprot:1231768-Amphidinium_carterae.3